MRKELLIALLFCWNTISAQSVKQVKEMVHSDSARLIVASEDFHHRVRDKHKTRYDYVFVGTANAELVAKAIREGKRAPFFNHSGTYQVDLSGIPLGIEIGTAALLEIFKMKS